jgi:hypothetical protein
MPVAPAPAPAPAPHGSFQAATTPPPTRPDKRKLYMAAGAAAAVVIALVAFVATRGGDSPNSSITTDSEPVETDSVPETEPSVAESAVVPVTDPGVSVADTTATVPPQTVPPETTPAPQPLTPDQLLFALVTPGEVQSTWIQGVFETGGDLDVCNSGFVDPNLNEQGVLFTRTVGGQLQQLTNATSTYADSATAMATITQFAAALRSCSQFDQVDPSSGQTLTFFPQVADEAPTAGCQAALSIRLDSMVTETAAPLASLFTFIEVCGNNAANAAFVIPATPDVIPADQLAELNAVLITSVNKLLTLPVVP